MREEAVSRVCAQCGTLGAGRFCANCGLALEGSAAAGGNLVREGFFKIIGVGEAIKVLLTLHKPVSGVRELVQRPNTAFKDALFAYIEFMLLVPLVLNALLLPLGRAVNYPVMFQGRVLEDQLISVIVSAAGLLIGVLVLYMLPRVLFRPRGKMIVIAAALFISMYATAYITLADFVKLGIWSVYPDFMTVAYFGNAVLLAILAFQVYVLRKVLELRWYAIAIFLVLGLTVGYAWGYGLAAAGLVTL